MTRSVSKVAIYGAGGFGREVAWLVRSCNVEDRGFEVACFIDDNELSHGKLLNGIPVTSLTDAKEQYDAALVVSGIGQPRLRQLTIEKALGADFRAISIIHPRVEMSEWVEIGAGTLICAGNILTTNISLGLQVQINLDCTLGHDVVIGDYTTLAPGVHISGNVKVGRRVYIGTGAVIINGTHEQPIVIGDDAVIGAAACVTKSVVAGTTVVGVPAKPRL